MGVDMYTFEIKAEGIQLDVACIWHKLDEELEITSITHKGEEISDLLAPKVIDELYRKAEIALIDFQREARLMAA